ncbi:unnamed protein product, partial [Brassica oleracea var. botrytis]
QSALFNFHSFLTVVLLVICTCTYLKMQFPAILEQKTGFVTFSPLFLIWIIGFTLYCACYILCPICHCRFRGFFWKAARI